MGAALDVKSGTSSPTILSSFMDMPSFLDQLYSAVF
jgi:hypothetical protein